ncbi:MAG: 3-phosphoshikimate 1-carboxyvinyltransferase [Candidatus Omnitrophota bacterium]
MPLRLFKPVSCIRGEVFLSGDKSIAHRSIILGAISSGKTRINNFPFNDDCLATINVFKKLGIKITLDPKNHTVIVFGKGLNGLKQPNGSIFIAESGTTLRLLLGILAGQNFEVTFTAGESLSKRPMLRVTSPLRLMGAQINAKAKTYKGRHEEFPPIAIKGCNLKPITYKMPIASAQVKSAILLAGLFTEGSTRVVEQIKTRDHTERMLRLFSADIKIGEHVISVRGLKELISPANIYIPGDISSASFFIVASLILPNSKIVIRKVGLNPSRMGIVKVLKRMGADILTTYLPACCPPAGRAGTDRRLAAKFEPIGNLLARSSILKGITIKREEIPSLIDELPILMVAACFAQGKTVLQGVEELRVKETDRIKSMCFNLRLMGARVEIVKEGNSENINIYGSRELKGAKITSFDDHRTAMSMIIAALAAKSKTEIDDIACINKSFPDFVSLLRSLSR